ncbi:hypothetical protein B9T31_03105 [Acinetobacter sp. ANC 4558]|uniref:hypothetical protein n=1 Tax=Acinetobacter sp. ANC 4558 TaxID=1977876 RepID=UPI000A338205|nr:hypothetical protein [Acinetobacter sp. ANC 4558]OTG87508.1 hypothetical protein B9T31_03105 [Acinetobacter sp. ANC 4558]
MINFAKNKLKRDKTMKIIILSCATLLLSSQIFAEDHLYPQKNFSLKAGYTEFDIHHKILGSEKVKSLEYSAAYDFSNWGIWGKYETQKIKKLKSNQYAIGAQYMLYQNRYIYTLASLGVGLTDINFNKKNYKTQAKYIYYPFNLELGYKLHPNLNIYTSIGYKWFKNKNTKMYYKDIKISDEADNNLDLHGQTYSIGLRFNF